MIKQHVNLKYDRHVDAAYLTLRKGRIANSEEVKPGVVLDYDKEGGILGVEILQFSKRFKAKTPKSPRTVMAAR